MAILQGSSADLQGGGQIIQGSSPDLQNTASPGLGQVLIGPAHVLGASATASLPGTGTPQSATDPNAVAYYNDVINQLQSQLRAAQGEQGTGLSNIANQYNQSLNTLNQGESTAESGFNKQQAQNAQQRESSLGNVNSNASASYNALMGLLGSAGAGVSSAAQHAAPLAIAKNASGQRAGVDTTYNANSDAINTALGATKQQYQSALHDLLTQKNSNTQGFLTSLLNQEGTIQQQLRDAQINQSQAGGRSYAAASRGAGNTTAAINNIQSQLQDIFKQYATPAYKVNPVAPSTPNLANYSTDPAAQKVAAANPSTDSSFLPYLQSLKQPNVLTGPPAVASAGAVK